MNTLITILVYLLCFAAIYCIIEQGLKPTEPMKRIILIILSLIVILALLGLLFGSPLLPRFSSMENLQFSILNSQFPIPA